MHRIAPWVILGVFLIYLAAAAFPPGRTPDGFRIGEFARLPVVMNGRVQPIDSVARAGLLRIRGTATVPAGGARPWQLWPSARPLEGSEWLLELLTKPDAADARRIFPIHDPALRAALHLSAAADGSLVYYTYAELRPGLEVLWQQAVRIQAIDAARRAPWETECLTLRNAVVIYDRFKNSLQPNSALQKEAGGNPIAYDFAAQVAQYQRDLQAGVTAARAAKDGKPQDPDTSREQRMDTFARPFLVVSRAALFSIVPVPGQARARDRWQNTGDSVAVSLRSGHLSPAVAMLAGMSSAFAQRNASAFNDQIARYQQWLTARRLTPELSRARDELFFTTSQPVARALTIYLVAVLLLCASRMSALRVLSRAAVDLIVLAFLVHTAGLLLGMMLGGRPPVTNVYERILVIGWVAVLIAGAAELRWRNGIGATAAAVAGLLTLAVAQSLAPGGAAELIRLGQQTSLWLAVAATAIVAAFCLPRASGRPRPSDQAVPLAAVAKAIGSAASIFRKGHVRLRPLQRDASELEEVKLGRWLVE
jgi:hypothetical protein